MSLKVLIVDDEKDTCTLLRKFLSRLGYQVFEAGTLKSGLSMIREILPDILFLDNNLPDGLGWEQISLIQHLHPAMHINLISAYKWVPGALSHNGTVKIIEKPITFATLKKFL